MAKEKIYWTGKRIKALRARLKLTQAAAAEKVGVTWRTWQLWEAGRLPSRPLQILLEQLEKGNL